MCSFRHLFYLQVLETGSQVWGFLHSTINAQNDLMLMQDCMWVYDST
jgi:hypothetical protein